MKHSLWIRWTHWLNFPLLTLMLWSGLEIYWANPAYINLPDSWWGAIGVPFHLSPGLALHFTGMWLFALNGLLYGGYLVVSGAWRELTPRPADFRDAFLVILHDLRLRSEAPIQGKFNAAQKIAYFTIYWMGVAATFTGLAIYKPVQLGGLTAFFGGYTTARLIHFLLAVGFVGFFVVHIGQVVRSGYRNFAAMITGFDQRVPHERRRFVQFLALFAAGIGFGSWLWTREEVDELPGPFRRVLETNASLAQKAFRPGATGEKVMAPPPGTHFRANGLVGLNSRAEEPWSLWLNDQRSLTLEQLESLPQTRSTTVFRCIEGWSQEISYEGVRFSDFLKALNLGRKANGDLYPYVGLATPDDEYYVSLDMASMLHPQTILALKINDTPLSAEHGAPVRLIVPVKYGIKHLKRLGSVEFADSPPPDYWAERGYDWYAGL